MTVRLTRIYTKTGDAGQTHLGDMSRVAKTDPRLVAYADVDEANSVLGVALALGSPPDEVAELLRSIQNDLFDVGVRDQPRVGLGHPAHVAQVRLPGVAGLRVDAREPDRHSPTLEEGHCCPRRTQA